ncbi:MAG TPA: RNA polymerase sigma-70 factor [Gemmatimonadaceae bacterium]|nr:RNA polymerase sigma-70 factor [Gemmatimonadaceae bacterium]
MDDRDLLARIRQGDQGAFDTLFRAHYAALVRHVEGMLRRRDVAEEVVQDVMLELWRRRETLVVDDSLRAYLYRATRNRALNHLRHEAIVRRSEPELTPDPESRPRGDAELVLEELDAAIKRAVAELPDRCREVFELSRMRGLKYSEIASTLGISVKTVEAQMGKALRLLRASLAGWLPGG